MSRNMSNKIKRQWLDPNYRAGFTGAATFYKALKKDDKLGKVSFNKVKELLETIPTYQMHVRSTKGPVRHLQFEAQSLDSGFVPGMGISFQMDLGIMPESQGKNV